MEKATLNTKQREKVTLQQLADRHRTFIDNRLNFSFFFFRIQFFHDRCF